MEKLEIEYVPTESLRTYPNNAKIHTLPDNAQIMFHGFRTLHVKLVENMIIGAADEDTGLRKADFLDKLEILLARADPAGNLRETVAAFEALIHCVAVLFAVQEEFALTDLALGAAEPVQIVIDLYNLFGGIRRSALLPWDIAEKGLPLLRFIRYFF